MLPPSSLPPVIAPLVGCAVALCSLWLGWRTVRTRSVPPLLAPLLRANRVLAEAVRGNDTAGRPRPERGAPDTALLYGWAWVYAGIFGLIVAGGQLLRVALG